MTILRLGKSPYSLKEIIQKYETKECSLLICEIVLVRTYDKRKKKDNLDGFASTKISTWMWIYIIHKKHMGVRKKKINGVKQTSLNYNRSKSREWK